MQELRKDSGLEMEDRITLYLATDLGASSAILSTRRTMSETLTRWD